MAGKSVTHSEDWWMLSAPAHTLRCTGHYKKDGSRCRREALAGTNVCAMHGGLTPAVQAAAATRIGMSVDDAVKRLLGMLDDPAVESRDKVKVLHDLLDRGGLSPTSKVMIGTTPGDPIDTLFRDLLSDPAALAPVDRAPTPPTAEQIAQAARQHAHDRGEDVWDAEVVEDVVIRDVPQLPPAPAPRPRRSGRARGRSATAGMPQHIRDAVARLDAVL